MSGRKERGQREAEKGTQGEHHPPAFPIPPTPSLSPAASSPSPFSLLHHSSLCSASSSPSPRPSPVSPRRWRRGAARRTHLALSSPQLFTTPGSSGPQGAAILALPPPPITALRPSDPSAAQPSPASPPRSPLPVRLLSGSFPIPFTPPASWSVSAAGDERGASLRPPRPRGIPRRRDLGGVSAAAGGGRVMRGAGPRAGGKQGPALRGRGGRGSVPVL